MLASDGFNVVRRRGEHLSIRSIREFQNVAVDRSFREFPGISAVDPKSPWNTPGTAPWTWRMAWPQKEDHELHYKQVVNST